MNHCGMTAEKGHFRIGGFNAVVFVWRVSPKTVLHRVRSSFSSLNFRYPLVLLRTYGSCLRLLPRLLVTLSLQSKKVFSQNSTYVRCDQAVYLSFYLLNVGLSLLLISLSYFLISHTFGTSDVLNPFPAPNF